MSLCNATMQMLMAGGLTVIEKCPVDDCGFPVARHRDEEAGMLVFDLTSFLWRDKSPTAMVMFPSNHFGQYVLNRQRVVDTIKTQITCFRSLDQEATASVYLSGRRGSGKTSLLTLLARSFHADGYQVYYFTCASAIPPGIEIVAFEKLLNNTAQKVTVVIDEVETAPNAALFTTLLKGAYLHLVTIGAAVSCYSTSGVTDKFSIKMPMSEIVLRQTNDDFRQLIDFCQRRNVTSPAQTETICNYLLDECGGHAYPTMKFIEYLFTPAEADVMASEEEFHKFFSGPKFKESEIYKLVVGRCFDVSNTDPGTTTAALRVLGDPECSTTGLDSSTLGRVGWWNRGKSLIKRNVIRGLTGSSTIPPVVSMGTVSATTCIEGNDIDVDVDSDVKTRKRPSTDDTGSGHMCSRQRK